MWLGRAAAICKLVCCAGVPIVCKVMRHQGLHRPVLQRSFCIVRFCIKRSTKTPKGLQAPSPGQAERSDATPWVKPRRRRYAPKGQKQRQRCNPIVQSPLSLLLPLRGASENLRLNPGCRSLRSLALGWKLVAPSGRSLNAGNCTPCYTLAIPYTPKQSTPKHFNS